MITTLPIGAINEYQQIYRKIYKREIAFEDAKKQAINLLNLFKAIYKPIKKKL